eukprot:3056042-Prymnesium_polylepis.1
MVSTNPCCAGTCNVNHFEGTIKSGLPVLHTRFTRVLHALHPLFTRCSPALHPRFARASHALHTRFTPISYAIYLTSHAYVHLNDTPLNDGSIFARNAFFIFQ